MAIEYKNNGRIYLHLPVEFTVSELSASAAEAINAVHTVIGKPNDFAEGGFNPYIFKLNDFDLGGAPFSREEGKTHAWCGPINNKSFLKTQDLQLIVAFGGDVEAWPMFFEVTDLDAAIPGSNPRFDTENGRMIWADLNVNDRGPWVEVNGKFYRGNEMEPTGQRLRFSETLELMQAGVSMVNAIPEVQ